MVNNQDEEPSRSGCRIAPMSEGRGGVISDPAATLIRLIRLPLCEQGHGSVQYLWASRSGSPSRHCQTK